LIEDKASGTQLIQELVGEGLHAVTRYVSECDKTMRLHAQTGAIENGFLHVPEEAHWLAEYLHDWRPFQRPSTTIRSNSTSQFLDWSKRRPAGWGGYEYYRQLAENLNRAKRYAHREIEGAAWYPARYHHNRPGDKCTA
jgi:hypothetical protein